MDGWDARGAGVYFKGIMKVNVLLLGWVVGLISMAPAAGVPRDVGGPHPKKVDLLKIIDTDHDIVLGRWSISDGILNSHPASSKANRIQIRVDPGKTYVLKIVVARKGGNPALIMGLSMAGKQFTVEIDGGKKGDVAGLSSIDGKSGASNETTSRKALLTNGTYSTIVCRVRNGRVIIGVDGRKVIDWKGSPARLSLLDEWQTTESGRALFIGCRGGEFKFRELSLQTFNGKEYPPEDPRARELRRFYEEVMRRERNK